MSQVQHDPRGGVTLLQWYGWLGLVRLSLDWIATKFSVPQAKILRRPFYMRGKRWISIGAGFISGPRLRLDALPIAKTTAPILTIGDNVQVNDTVHVGAVQSVTIGNRVLIASNVFITDHNHGTYSEDGEHSDPHVPPALRPLSCSPVRIEDDVWIGEYVVVLPGVTIGRGSIIGAMSVVSRDIPPYSIAVGSPARIVKQFDAESQRWEKV
jgi:lipopolysaccharide O-acetyltransferase